MNKSIAVTIEKKRKYVYVSFIDSGYEKSDDPWDYPIRVGPTDDYYVAKFRFLLRDLFLFEDATRNIIEKLHSTLHYENLEQGLTDLLGSNYRPLEELEHVFFRAGIVYKKLYFKGMKFN